VELTRRRVSTRTRAAWDEPLLVTRTEHNRVLVAACCTAAAGRGVQSGMTVADARALLRTPCVRIEQHRPERDDDALRSLARWALRFTPAVGVDPPDGLLLNITGCAHLFGGEDRMLACLERAVSGLGFTPRVAVAPTGAGARALARHGASRVCVPDLQSLREALGPLPPSSLRLEPGIIAALAEVGITRLGELFALPRSTIPSRFGASLLRCMDEALGLLPERFDTVRDEEPIRVERCLSGPTHDLGVLAIVARQLLRELAVLLRARALGVRTLDAVFDRPGWGQHRLTLALARATRDARHLWGLLWPRLERMPLCDGVERVEVIAVRSSRVREAQLGHWAPVEEDDPAARAGEVLCEMIAARIGPERVLRPRVQDSHLPEHSVALRPARVGPAKPEVQGPPLHPHRPSVLLTPPEPARAIEPGAPGQAPASMFWRGRVRTLCKAIGPERLADAWWERCGPGGDTPARDYFRVQDQSGYWLWIYHESASNRWLVQGLWA